MKTGQWWILQGGIKEIDMEDESGEHEKAPDDEDAETAAAAKTKSRYSLHALPTLQIHRSLVRDFCCKLLRLFLY